MKTLYTKLTELNDLFESNSIDLDISYTLTEEHTNFCDLYEALEDNDLLNVDIIYYFEAMKYLSTNDPSLNGSLEIAQEYGIELRNINSELLASLHATQKLREEFSALSSEIDRILGE